MPDRQQFPRSSIFPSLPSARLSLRHSLTRKRRRGGKQLQPTLPLTPIPEANSQEASPPPPVEVAGSSAYTSGLNTTTTSPHTIPSTTATSPDPPQSDLAAPSPISPLTPNALDLTSPSSPTPWYTHLPYPSASRNPLPPANTSAIPPWDPRANWRNSYIPVLKAWEAYVSRHLSNTGGSFSPSQLTLQFPTTPPPRLSIPSSISAPCLLMAEEEIRWNGRGSPMPPPVPPKDSPVLLPQQLIAGEGLEVATQPHAGPSRCSPSLPGSWPPSPAMTEPPSPRSECSDTLSPFPSPPSVRPSETRAGREVEEDKEVKTAEEGIQVTTSDLPELVPESSLHVAFSPSPPLPQRRPSVVARHSSSFPVHRRPRSPRPYTSTSSNAGEDMEPRHTSRQRPKQEPALHLSGGKQSRWTRLKENARHAFGSSKVGKGRGERGWEIDPSAEPSRMKRVWRAVTGKGKKGEGNEEGGEVEGERRGAKTFQEMRGLRLR